MENIYTDETYLSHHGIIGQKWGVRRYQNRDGSLTSEGRKRRGLSDKKEDGPLKKLANKAKDKKAESEAEKHEQLRKYVRDHPKDIFKHRDEFTKDELNQLVNDIEFDRKLKDVRNQEIQRNWDKVKSMSNNLGTVKNVAENMKGVYNLACDVNNTLIDTGKMNGKKMTKIGETKREDRSAWNKLVMTGSKQDILNNIGNLTPAELDSAMKRLKYEEQLKNP